MFAVPRQAQKSGRALLVCKYFTHKRGKDKQSVRSILVARGGVRRSVEKGSRSSCPQTCDAVVPFYESVNQ